MDFLAAFSALTWLGVFLDGVLVPEAALETDLVSSLSAATVSEVTLLALFILSDLGVFTETQHIINIMSKLYIIEKGGKEHTKYIIQGLS